YYVKNIVDTDVAITALKNHEVNVLDSQYHIEIQPSFLIEWGASKIASYDAFGVQEMGVNMKHPLIGTGVDTPLGKSDPTKAALAGIYVWRTRRKPMAASTTMPQPSMPTSP